jgi:hypothetical protein
VVKQSGDQGAANVAAKQAAEAAKTAAMKSLQDGGNQQSALEAAKKAGQEAAKQVR